MPQSGGRISPAWGRVIFLGAWLDLAEPVSGGVARLRVGRYLLALQAARPLNHAREVSDRPFIDDRGPGFVRLPDFRQVAAGQDGQEAWCHPSIKAGPAAGKSSYRLGPEQFWPLQIAGVDKPNAGLPGLALTGRALRLVGGALGLGFALAGNRLQHRVECSRCSRAVEIQRLDAVKLYGPHAIWKDVGQRLLDDGCKIRTGRHEEDGCWPEFKQ
jgi:hypothetical protein